LNQNDRDYARSRNDDDAHQTAPEAGSSVIWSDPAFRLFVNSVVAVSTRDRETVNAMSAEWCTPLSIAPVLLGVLVGHSRWTHSLIQRTWQAGLSLLAEDQAGVAHLLGDSSGRDHNKLNGDGPDWFSGPSLGLPLIRAAAAHFECQVTAVHTVGDHDLIVMAPVWCGVATHAKPLVYHRGHYFTLPEPLCKPAP
jgi:flavin reductase (DIM6/NTAB) family NADH-FMN oxidoreductase RutF